MLLYKYIEFEYDFHFKNNYFQILDVLKHFNFAIFNVNIYKNYFKDRKGE